MKTITGEDGETYVLKTDMENAIKDRISKVTQRAVIAEQQIEELQGALKANETKNAAADTLQEQITQYKMKLENMQNKHNRYKAISKHGLVDDEMIDAIEWSYEKSQKNIDKEQQKPLHEWFEHVVKNPSEAPKVLQPHLQQLAKTENIQAAQKQPDKQPEKQEIKNNAVIKIPNVNQGAQPPTDTPDIINRGLYDNDFYASNRDQIIKQWRSKYGR